MLKGKRQGTEVFEPLAEADSGSDRVNAYLEAYELLRAEQPGALERFAELHRRYPEDSLVRFHLRRLESGQGGTRVALDK